MGKIEVYFKNLNVAGDKSYYHEFIVWTPDNGRPQFIRGGPKSNGDLGSDSGGGSGSSGSAIGKNGVDVPFGAILVKSGFYDQNHAQDWAKLGLDPGQSIITGSDQQLQPYWQRMLAEKDAINKANVGYAVAGPNSNTVITTLLQAVRLPQPKNNGLDDAMPAPGADMSLLGQHYSAGRGYDELAANAGARGLRNIEHGIGAMMNDIGDGVGGTIRAFCRALKTVAGRRNAVMREVGLYDVAMTAGRPGLGGFAPVTGMGRRLMPQKSRPVAAAGEAGIAAQGRFAAPADAGAFTVRQAAGVELSCRAVVEQARQQAAVARARRETERAVLRLSAGDSVSADNGAAKNSFRAGMSFAPLAGHNVVDGESLHSGPSGVAAVPGLTGGSRHLGMATAAEAAPAWPGVAEGRQDEMLPRLGLEQPGSFELERALDDYFFRKSRLPPAGGAGFNPLLSPVWAGMKIPG